MKPTIEDLKETRTFYKRDRDASGKETKEPYQKKVKRNVQVVSGFTRFGHYLIDAIIIGAITYGIEMLIFGSYASSHQFSTHTRLEYTYSFIPALDQIIITVGYYFFCELILQRTIGKYATNSVVINQYAEAPETNSLLGRSFARLVPFEALSCLGDRGWHDTWSKTYVVTVTERDRLKRLLNEQEGFFLSDSEDTLD